MEEEDDDDDHKVVDSDQDYGCVAQDRGHVIYVAIFPLLPVS